MKEAKFNKWFCIVFLILIYGVITYLGYGSMFLSLGYITLIIILINLPQSKFVPKETTKETKKD